MCGVCMCFHRCFHALFCCMFSERENAISSYQTISTLSEAMDRHKYPAALSSFEDPQPFNPNDCTNSKLHIAVALTQCVDEVEYILLSQKLKNRRNIYGETALLLATKLNVSDEIILKLIEHGCDIRIGDKNKFTPLHFASRYNKIGIVQAFTSLGSDVNARTTAGVTPLHEAVLNSHYEIVQILLGYGANPLSATLSRASPCELAVVFTEIDPRILAVLIQSVSEEAQLTKQYPYLIERALRAKNVQAANTLLEEIEVFNGDICRSRHWISCLDIATEFDDPAIFNKMVSRMEMGTLPYDACDFLLKFTNENNFDFDDFLRSLILVLESKIFYKFPISITNALDDAIFSYFLNLLCEKLLEHKIESNERAVVFTCLTNAMQVLTPTMLSIVHKHFGFGEELERMLFSDKIFVSPDCDDILEPLIYRICFNKIDKVLHYNLRDHLKYLEYSTPNEGFRMFFHFRFSKMETQDDPELDKWRSLYQQCKEHLTKRWIADLKELCRDAIRRRIYSLVQESNPFKVYMLMKRLPVPEPVKNILYLKRPLYVND